VVYRLDDTLGFSIHRTGVRLRQCLGQQLRALDLTPEQFGVLARLWEQDGLPQKELGRLLYKDKPTITRMLEKLDQRQLIRRVPDARDRRVYRVYLTPAGQALQVPVLEAITGLRSRAYRGLSVERQELLKAQLDRIFDNLC
jgi:MarR family transcriptional regulator for hemolysin